MAAGDISSDHDAIPDLERYALKVQVVSAATDGRNRPHVFMPLDDRETNLLALSGAGILRGVALIGMLVGAADARQLHLHDDTTGFGLWKGILPYFVLAGLDERGGQNAITGHRCRSFSGD
jgi:hypothetical protein